MAIVHGEETGVGTLGGGTTRGDATTIGPTLPGEALAGKGATLATRANTVTRQHGLVGLIDALDSSHPTLEQELRHPSGKEVREGFEGFGLGVAA